MCRRIRRATSGYGTESRSEIEVRRDETTDVGTLDFAEPGWIDIRASVDADELAHLVLARRLDGIGSARFERGDGGAMSSGALAPGRWRIQLLGRRWRAETRDVDVAPGRRVAIELEVTSGR